MGETRRRTQRLRVDLTQTNPDIDMPELRTQLVTTARAILPDESRKP